MTEAKIDPAAGAAAPVPIMVTEAMFDALADRWKRGPAPVYKMEMLAKFFFGMSASWLRLKLKPDEDHPQTWFVRDGERMDFRRSKPDQADSARVFLISDVEPMAWSLFRLGAIPAVKLGHILRVVQAEAVLYGLIAEDGNDDEETAAGDTP